MPSSQTKHYKLSQWEADDRVQRTDFNADNAKIDAALGMLTAEFTKDRTVTGTIIGDKTMGRVIQLPWAPKLIIFVGTLNDDPAVAYLTPDICYYSTGRQFHEATIYSPKLSGSTLTLNIWFNETAPSYYIAFR